MKVDVVDLIQDLQDYNLNILEFEVYCFKSSLPYGRYYNLNILEFEESYCGEILQRLSIII